MTIRSTCTAAALAVLCVLLLQPLFIGSLMFVRAHTDLAPIRHHILAAFDADVLAVSEFPSATFPPGGHQFTECTALHVAIDDEPDLLTVALRPQEHSRVVGSCGELFDFISDAGIPYRTDYSRYWHGYRLYIWPMLEHFSLERIRYINAGILLIAIVVFALGMRRAIGADATAVLLVVLLSLTDIWRIWTITPHFLPTAFILFGCGAFASAYAHRPNPTCAIIAGAVLGAIFNFIDFLVNPPMMPMLLAFTVIAVALMHDRDAEPQPRGLLTAGGLVAAAWFGGYALTWAIKWALAIGLSPHPREALTLIADQILLRTYGQETEKPIPFFPLLATVRAAIQSFISIGSIPVAALAAAIGLALHRRFAAFDRRRFLLLAAPSLVPLFWFELLSSHTRTHLHFTYRSEAAAIAVVFAAAFMTLPAAPPLTTLFAPAALRMRRLLPGTPAMARTTARRPDRMAP